MIILTIFDKILVGAAMVLAFILICYLFKLIGGAFLNKNGTTVFHRVIVGMVLTFIAVALVFGIGVFLYELGDWVLNLKL